MIKKYDPDAFHHHPNPLVRFIEAKRVEAIFKMRPIAKEDRLLEIGCGAGNVIEKAKAGKLFAVDISSSVLLKAKQRLNETAYVIQGDAQSLPCKTQAFTEVICSEVLEHLIDPSAALSEMARILSANGVAVISVPNESMINGLKKILIQLGIFGWLFRRKGNYRDMPERMEDEWHLHAFELKEWLDLFRRSFRVSALRKIPFWWFPIRYVVRLEKIT